MTCITATSGRNTTVGSHLIRLAACIAYSATAVMHAATAIVHGATAVVRGDAAVMHGATAVKSSWVQEPLAISEPAEGPLVIELKSSWVQEPGEVVAEAAPAEAPSALRMAVNQKKRVVIDVWWMNLSIALEEPESDAVSSVGRPAKAA